MPQARILSPPSHQLFAVASFLRGRRNELLSEWEHAVQARRNLRKRGLRRPLLLDDVPQILELAADIAEAQAGAQRDPAPAPEEASRHALDGAEQEMAEVSAEYTLLRESIVRRVAEAPGLGVGELRFVQKLIDEAATIASRSARIRELAARERDADGEVLDAIPDVSARDAARHELDGGEEQFRTLANSIPQLAWMADATGFIFWYNQRWYDYTGTTLEEMRGWGWQKVHHPEHTRRVVERIRRAFETGEAWEDTFPLRGSNGEYRRFLSRAFPIVDEHGHLVRWFGTNTDIEERLRAEEELQRRIAFEEQLIGIVSHDLRNPIHAIRLGTELLLRREDLGEHARKTLKQVTSSAERASRLVTDLLDFTRERMGKAMPLDRRPADLHEHSRALLEEVRLAHPGRQIEEIHSGDGHGEWDTDRLGQVLTNLLRNALAYSPPDSVVRVSTRGEEDAVSLEVHNTGTPIPAAIMRCLFQPFERGRAGDAASRSIGLGLFIVDTIVRAHGGSVVVRSDADEGTTFSIRLPRSASSSLES